MQELYPGKNKRCLPSGHTAHFGTGKDRGIKVISLSAFIPSFLLAILPGRNRRRLYGRDGSSKSALQPSNRLSMHRVSRQPRARNANTSDKSGKMEETLVR